MIGTVEVRCSAHRPQMPLQPFFTFCGSPSSVRIMDVPKSIGDWSIDEVKLVVKYPDNSTTVKNAVRNGCVWVATIQGTDIAGKVSNGYEIVASGKDEDGNDVNGYVLGCGDVIVINRDVNATKDIEKFYVKWNDELPANPVKGDVIYHNGNVRLFNGSEWLTLGIEPQIIEGIDNRINEVESSIPTKTSELVNDSDFATNASVDEKIGGVTSSIPTKTSQLDNDSDFADKNFVNSSIATNTANFKGTYESSEGWPTDATNNDYLFWKTVDENGNTIYKRYKYIASTSTWTYEYTLNNSSFTAEQWATINGGPYATQTSLNDKQDKLPYNDVWDVYDVGCWNAVNATRDVNGKDIDATYATKEELNNAIGNVLTQEVF